MNIAELQIQMRRDTAANWTSADPVLESGEIGYETDTGFWKWGDGATAWTTLAYDSQFGGDVNIAGTLQSNKIIAGDPGLEGTGIVIGGVNYDSDLKVSGLGSANPAQFILHHHSTTLPSVRQPAK